MRRRPHDGNIVRVDVLPLVAGIPRHPRAADQGQRGEHGKVQVRILGVHDPDLGFRVHACLDGRMSCGIRGRARLRVVAEPPWHEAREVTLGDEGLGPSPDPSFVLSKHEFSVPAGEALGIALLELIAVALIFPVPCGLTGDQILF